MFWASRSDPGRGWSRCTEPSEGGEGGRVGGQGYCCQSRYMLGERKEAGKPVRLQWWHWRQKTAGLPWIPAAAGE